MISSRHYGRPPADAPRFYGRRKGRGLTAYRRRLLETLLPTLAFDPPPDERIVDPRRWFGAEVTAVWLEVGCGKGEHLAHRAGAHPTVGLVGCEPFEAGVAGLLATIEARGLGNVRIHAEDARPLLPRLAPASLERVFVLFPDPWPKTRHRDRRLMTGAVLDALAAALADGGILRFATDDARYLTDTLALVLAHGAFDWPARSATDWRRPADQGPMSRYEARAAAQGRKAIYLTFVRRARTLQPMSSSGT
ncbi:MAG: tRNA (guanosine(46)-N7)-methyltransferase TrmB [Alphaproteobacteria bacterium]|nr:tRNA (guanosine(46)-N7)-methyltransferase TrmB [Alphaproteobacteria bacterium]